MYKLPVQPAVHSQIPKQQHHKIKCPDTDSPQIPVLFLFFANQKPSCKTGHNIRRNNPDADSRIRHFHTSQHSCKNDKQQSCNDIHRYQVCQYWHGTRAPIFCLIHNPSSLSRAYTLCPVLSYEGSCRNMNNIRRSAVIVFYFTGNPKEHKPYPCSAVIPFCFPGSLEKVQTGCRNNAASSPARPDRSHPRRA